eukprot:2923018-Amphidinium_carterae.1
MENWDRLRCPDAATKSEAVTKSEPADDLQVKAEVKEEPVQCAVSPPSKKAKIDHSGQSSPPSTAQPFVV